MRRSPLTPTGTSRRAPRSSLRRDGPARLDWHNGNRTILVDQKLTGLIVGYTLSTRPEESTGASSRRPVRRPRHHRAGRGIRGEIGTIITAGGLAEKNDLLMQIYADITGRELKISASAQTCALGAAIFGAIAAGPARGGFADAGQAQEKLCRFKKKTYRPKPGNRRVYDRSTGFTGRCTTPSERPAGRQSVST